MINLNPQCTRSCKHWMVFPMLGYMLCWSNLGHAQANSNPAEPLRSCTINDADWKLLIDEALSAYKQMETESFIEQRSDALEHVLCLSSVVTPQTVAVFHQMEVLHSFMNKDKAAFAAHVRAAELADPSAPLSESGLVNDGHPVLQWYTFVKEEKVATRIRLPVPELGHSIYIDGASAVGYPSDLPYIFQRVVDGAVEESVVVGLDAPVPTYPLYEDPTLRVGLHPELTLVSAGSLGIALTTAMLASRAESKFWDPSTPNDDLIPLKRRTNVYSSIGIVAGISSVGALGMAYWKGTHSVAVD